MWRCRAGGGLCVNTPAPPDFAASPYPPSPYTKVQQVQLGMCDVVECAPSKICYAALMLVELLTWRCLVLEDPESLGPQVAQAPKSIWGPFHFYRIQNLSIRTMSALRFCPYCSVSHPESEMRRVLTKSGSKWRCLKSLQASKKPKAERDAFGKRVSEENGAARSLKQRIINEAQTT